MSSVSNAVELSIEAQQVKDRSIQEAGRIFAYALTELSAGRPAVSEVAA